MVVYYHKVDYVHILNWTSEQRDETVREVWEFVESKKCKYLGGKEGALALISMVVLYSADSPWGISGFVDRDTADRATGKREGNPPPEGEDFVYLVNDHVCGCGDSTQNDSGCCDTCEYIDEVAERDKELLRKNG